ncbi:hypothetical protein D3C78_839310 [compost metagenome]
MGEWLDFEYAHRSVPYDKLGVLDHVCIQLASFRADVNAFPISRNAVYINDLCISACAKIIGYHNINRNQEVFAELFGFLHELKSQIKLAVIY